MNCQAMDEGKPVLTSGPVDSDLLEDAMEDLPVVSASDPEQGDLVVITQADVDAAEAVKDFRSFWSPGRLISVAGGGVQAKQKESGPYIASSRKAAAYGLINPKFWNTMGRAVAETEQERQRRVYAGRYLPSAPLEAGCAVFDSTFGWAGRKLGIF